MRPRHRPPHPAAAGWLACPSGQSSTCFRARPMARLRTSALSRVLSTVCVCDLTFGQHVAELGEFGLDPRPAPARPRWALSSASVRNPFAANSAWPTTVWSARQGDTVVALQASTSRGRSTSA